MEHDFKARSVQELEDLALQKELEVIEVYNPFTSGFGNMDFPENDDLKPFEKDGTFNIILDNKILMQIPPKGKRQISAKYQYYATKPLVDRLIIENETTKQVNLRTNQEEITNGLPLIHEDAYRRKYMAVVLGKTELKNAKVEVEKPKQEVMVDNTENEGFEGLNDDKEARKAELEEMETSELRSLVEQLGAEPKDSRRRSDMIEAILDKELA